VLLLLQQGATPSNCLKIPLSPWYRAMEETLLSHLGESRGYGK